MRTRFIVLFSTIFLISAIIALPLPPVSANRRGAQNAATPQVSSVPISEEHHHHLVLANSFMQAYEVEVPPHDSTLLHRHDQDYVYIVFGDADITNAVENNEPVKAHLADTTVNFAKGPFAHVARDDGNTIFRNITVQLLQPQGELKTYFSSVTAALAAADKDPNNIHVRRMKGATEVVILETGEMRALAVNVKPGAAWTAVNSEHTFLAVWIDRWRERLHPGKPNAEIFPIQMETWFAPSGETSIRNTLPTPMNIFILEFKNDN
nr:hypothetical protein [Candidatus Acidoferrales bacterium]